MNRNILVILFLFIILCGSNYVFGQPKDVKGWNKTYWGMTEEEILETFKEKAVRHREGVNSKLNVTIVINEIDIRGDKFKVKFITDKNKTLQELRVVPSEINPSEHKFKMLEEMLVQKYGAPSYKENERRGFVSLLRAWNFPTTVIQLSYLVSPPFKNSVTRLILIKYRPNLIEDLDNL